MSAIEVAVGSPSADSPTWPFVLGFAVWMEQKLSENRHKGGRESWLRDDPLALLARLREEAHELEAEIVGLSMGFSSELSILREAADVANFAMMIADSVTRSRPVVAKVNGPE